MQAIVNGSIFMPDHIEKGACLLFAEKIIGVVAPGEVPMDAGVIDAKGGAVIPGLIDMHIHGYLGAEDVYKRQTKSRPSAWSANPAAARASPARR